MLSGFQDFTLKKYTIGLWAIDPSPVLRKLSKGTGRLNLIMKINQI